MVKNIIILIAAILALNAKAEIRKKIVVIDSGIASYQKNKPYMCRGGVVSAYNDSGLDSVGHGTNIIDIISKQINYKKYCIVSIKVYNTSATANTSKYELGIKKAYELKPHIVNISMTGDSYLHSEFFYINKMLQFNTKVIVAAGNSFKNLDLGCDVYPACLKNIISTKYNSNFIVVSNVDTGHGNYGAIVSRIMPGKQQGNPVMSGTSQSTANMTAKLVVK